MHSCGNYSEKLTTLVRRVKFRLGKASPTSTVQQALVQATQDPLQFWTPRIWERLKKSQEIER